MDGRGDILRWTWTGIGRKIGVEGRRKVRGRRRRADSYSLMLRVILVSRAKREKGR